MHSFLLHKLFSITDNLKMYLRLLVRLSLLYLIIKYNLNKKVIVSRCFLRIIWTLRYAELREIWEKIIGRILYEIELFTVQCVHMYGVIHVNILNSLRLDGAALITWIALGLRYNKGRPRRLSLITNKEFWRLLCVVYINMCGVMCLNVLQRCYNVLHVT